MTMAQLFLEELNREADRCRRVLEQVPPGQHDWKPHDKSMIFGYLAGMVATMPQWIAMEITQDELDVAPAEPRHLPPPMQTSAEYLTALDRAVGAAREALSNTTEEFLQTPWKLLARGQVVLELPRYLMIRETFNHLAHHRGQMTVYLRLMGAKVPALYGPSADDRRFD